MKIVQIQNMLQTNEMMQEAIKISDWCKGQGLHFQSDYDWHFSNKDETLCVRFYDHCEEMSSLFALKWIK
jgi:hypothetical protein